MMLEFAIGNLQTDEAYTFEIIENKHISLRKTIFELIKDLESKRSEYTSIEDKLTIEKQFLQRNSKDEKLIELLPLLKKNIELPWLVINVQGI